MKDFKLKIDEIKCTGCINRIKNVLSKIKGIKKYDISLDNKILNITTKEENIDNIIKRIEEIDFKVKLMEK